MNPDDAWHSLHLTGLVSWSRRSLPGAHCITFTAGKWVGDGLAVCMVSPSCKSPLTLIPLSIQMIQAWLHLCFMLSNLQKDVLAFSWSLQQVLWMQSFGLGLKGTSHTNLRRILWAWNSVSVQVWGYLYKGSGWREWVFIGHQCLLPWLCQYRHV